MGKEIVLSITNVRDMLAEGQEDIVNTYIGMFSSKAELEDGSVKVLNLDIERFLNTNAIHKCNSIC